MQSIFALRTLRARAPAALLLAVRPTGSIAGDVSCVGWDGSPLRFSGDVKRRQGKEEESKEAESDLEYYEKHKPSPLSEVEFVDTRKPITQATAHGGGGGSGGGVEEEEHLLARETLEDALLLAEEIWMAAKTAGVPDYPHSRALARALAERDFKAIA